METTDTLQSAVCVRNIMTSQVHTLHMDDSLRTATSLFERERFHHVVIVERGRVQGVVSDRDILKAASPFVNNPILERPQDASTLKKRIHQIMTRTLVTVGPVVGLGALAWIGGRALLKS